MRSGSEDQCPPFLSLGSFERKLFFGFKGCFFVCLFKMKNPPPQKKPNPTIRRPFIRPSDEWRLGLGFSNLWHWKNFPASPREKGPENLLLFGRNRQVCLIKHSWLISPLRVKFAGMEGEGLKTGVNNYIKIGPAACWCKVSARPCRVLAQLLAAPPNLLFLGLKPHFFTLSLGVAAFPGPPHLLGPLLLRARGTPSLEDLRVQAANCWVREGGGGSLLLVEWGSLGVMLILSPH